MTRLCPPQGARVEGPAAISAELDGCDDLSGSDPPDGRSPGDRAGNRYAMAPWYFELLSFELANLSKKATCRHITFLMELCKSGYEWRSGRDIWRAIGCASRFPLFAFFPLLEKLNCVEVDRRIGEFGVTQVYFRIKRHVHLVKRDTLLGQQMEQMYSALKEINLLRPRQTPRIGLLLFAIVVKKLTKRSEIDDYLCHASNFAEHVVHQIQLLIELNFIKERKTCKGQHDRHFLYPVQ
jgi:hypothetical protein